jgi:mRNA interferase MazF
MAAYVPVQGDLVVLTFDPQAGHEQMGRRPAIVVSVEPFNRATRLAVCCPITNTRRDTPFHVPVPAHCGLTGYVMCEQMKSIDYRARRAKKIGSAPREFLDEVLSVVDASIFPESR